MLKNCCMHVIFMDSNFNELFLSIFNFHYFRRLFLSYREIKENGSEWNLVTVFYFLTLLVRTFRFLLLGVYGCNPFWKAIHNFGKKKCRRQVMTVAAVGLIWSIEFHCDFVTRLHESENWCIILRKHIHPTRTQNTHTEFTWIAKFSVLNSNNLNNKHAHTYKFPSI